MVTDLNRSCYEHVKLLVFMRACWADAVPVFTSVLKKEAFFEKIYEMVVACQQGVSQKSIGVMNSCIYVVTGPTAVGKTSLCLRVARELQAEVISCDSMQLYKGMDIGTAKATEEELAKVPHHCLDVFDVRESGNVQKYEENAKVAVSDIVNRGKRILVTGGSGFYLKSFLEPVCDEVQIPEMVRLEVEQMYTEGGVEVMVERLLELNSAGVGGLDLKNPRRVVRALERCLASGMSVLELKEKMQELPEPYPRMEKRVCVLTRSDENLKARISQRVEAMLSGGLIEEVAGLVESGLQNNPVASAAIGYREVLDYLDGEISSLEELAATLNRNTWQLVRKQKKWFRTQLPEARVVNLDTCPDPTLEDLFGTKA